MTATTAIIIMAFIQVLLLIGLGLFKAASKPLPRRKR